jgi:hypothetical protein
MIIVTLLFCSNTAELPEQDIATPKKTNPFRRFWWSMVKSPTKSEARPNSKPVPIRISYANYITANYHSHLQRKSSASVSQHSYYLVEGLK